MKTYYNFDNVDLNNFIEKSKNLKWSQDIIHKNLKEFLFSHNFSKKQIFDIFFFFNFSYLDALQFYLKKISYLSKYKLGNFNKLKNCFTIYMFIYDTIYFDDIIDCHSKMTINSNLNTYYDFIPKINILKGWSSFQLLALLGEVYSPNVLFHIQTNSNFFIKIGVFTDDVKAILIKIITMKDITENDNIFVLRSLIEDIRFKANLSLIHIFKIITSDVIVIYDLFYNFYFDYDPIKIDYYTNHQDIEFSIFYKAAYKYYNDFYNDFELYQKSFDIFLNKFKKKEPLSSQNSIMNNFLHKIKKLSIFNKKIDNKNEALKDYINSINNSNKQDVFIIDYFLTDSTKLDIFNNILSIYNSRLYNNKQDYYKLSALVAKGEGPIDEYPDPFEGIDNEDGYYIFDLTELDEKEQEKIERAKKLNKLLIEDVERNLDNLSLDFSNDELISYTFVDSFNYLSYFYVFFKAHDLTTEEICLILRSNIYINK